MQLCKCINFFLKTHNKQINQYCLNFTIFFTQKKSFKKMVGVQVESCVGSGWPAKNTGRIMGQPVFASGQKNRVRVGYFSGWVGLENSYPFCHVYLSSSSEICIWVFSLFALSHRESLCWGEIGLYFFKRKPIFSVYFDPFKFQVNPEKSESK